MSEIEKILNDVEFASKNINFDPFTKKGYDIFKEKIGIYIGSLYLESQKTAKRHKADTISKSHVETASSYLIKNHDSKISKLSGVLGGVLLGAAVSNLLAMTVLGQAFNTLGIVTTIVLGIIGSFMVGINMVKE